MSNHGRIVGPGKEMLAHFHFQTECLKNGVLGNLPVPTPPAGEVNGMVRRPQADSPGLHAIDVRLKDRTGLHLDARKSYWAEGSKAPDLIR